jgi:hypothetical protein
MSKTESQGQTETQNPVASSDWFGWFYRTSDPSHVIALCGGHKYLAGRGWQPGEGSLAGLPTANLCCVCMGTASIRRMRDAPMKPNYLITLKEFLLSRY